MSDAVTFDHDQRGVIRTQRSDKWRKAASEDSHAGADKPAEMLGAFEFSKDTRARYLQLVISAHQVVKIRDLSESEIHACAILHADSILAVNEDTKNGCASVSPHFLKVPQQISHGLQVMGQKPLQLAMYLF